MFSLVCLELMFWLCATATGEEAKQANQIFSTNAASGILTNDLIKIIETEQVCKRSRSFYCVCYSC